MTTPNRTAAARRGMGPRHAAALSLAALSAAACTTAATPRLAATAPLEFPAVVVAVETPQPVQLQATVPVRIRPGRRVRVAAAGVRYKVGAPYRVGGALYIPADQPTYDEVGVASWYGSQFNGRHTADGERFDMYAASAAHTTLPIPSIVEVTNLENGRSIRVRLNDRGPFKPGRIIDLSRSGAEQLGYLDKGLARVRVRYIGPGRLDGSTEPLYVAQAAPADPVGRPTAAPPPAGPASRGKALLQLASAPARETPTMLKGLWRSPPYPVSDSPARSGSGFAALDSRLASLPASGGGPSPLW